jgi:hypothetical protein
MYVVAVLLLKVPSLTVTVMMRLAVDGFVVVKATWRSAVW